MGKSVQTPRELEVYQELSNWKEPRWGMVRAIGRNIGMGRANVGDYLKRLVNRGQAERVGRGMYKAVKSDAERKSNP
jgi:predicted transcriptional regulator